MYVCMYVDLCTVCICLIWCLGKTDLELDRVLMHVLGNGNSSCVAMVHAVLVEL